MNISQRNTVSNTSLITYEEYKGLVAAYYESLKDLTVNFDKSVFIEKLANLIGTKQTPQLIKSGEEVTKKELKDRIDQAATDDDENATQLLYGKLYALTSRGTTLEDLDISLDPFAVAFADFVDKTGGTAEPSIKNSALLADDNFDNVTMGKVFMSFIGHSMAMSGLFDEVQMFFYPMNINSGGARIHTTASFPLNKDDLFEAVVKKVSKNPNMSVNSFFNLVERKLMRDNKNFVYELDGPEKTFEEDLKKLEKDEEEFKKKAEAEKKQAGDDFEEFSKKLKAEEQEIIERRKSIKQKRRDGVRKECSRIYMNDGGPPAEPVFVRPNISMYMETVTGMSVADQKTMAGQPKTNEDRAKFEKAICRIHIYDEESVSKPFENFLNGLLTEGASGRAVVESSNVPDSTMIEGKEVESIISGEEFQGSLKNYILTVPPTVIKDHVKKAYPSITYGASTGVIKNISISSNVSNNVSQVILISSIANKNNPQSTENKNTDTYDEMKVVPATVTVEMIGNPFIQRGNQIYIDFGTNTTLDNVYTVKSVKHSISAGEFSTTVDLIFAGQGEVSSIREKIESAIDSL